MEKFYNNHNNGTAEFAVDISGATPADVRMRFIFEKDNKIFVIPGKIKENKCFFEIPAINIFEKNQEGKVYIEAIYNDELYFRVWEETFAIEAKTEIKVNEGIHREAKESKESDVKISLGESKLTRKVDEPKKSKSQKTKTQKTKTSSFMSYDEIKNNL